MHKPSHTEYPLTPYDEFPVHQAPYPISYIPSTDYAWDEGYFYAAYSADAQVIMITGMRINPNADIIGAHVGVNIGGRQRTARLSREWRKHWDTQVGPLRYQVIEPYRNVRLSLEKNESGLCFDINWLGLAPAHLSSHHAATVRGRRTTDQTRYNQVGAARGWIELDGVRFEVRPESWGACRDHSWGIYEARPPLVPEARWIPPKPASGPQRAMRFSMFFAAGDYSGHFHLHDDEDGLQLATNDVFGIPFEGGVDRGFEQPRVHFVEIEHQLQFMPNTRAVSRGAVQLRDEAGGLWKIEFEVAWAPAPVIQAGYHQGSWRDGGTIATYHGPADPYIEWDEFDFSSQPVQHTLYGQTEARSVHGVEHVARITLTDPQGRTSSGQAEIEVFLNGRYAPYGFKAQESKGGLTGRGVV